MSLTKLLKAATYPGELYGTFILFLNLGSSWDDAFRNAVDCIVIHRLAV